MKLYALVLFLACVSAAPQVGIEEDSELVSTGGSSVGSAGGDRGFANIPFFTIFRRPVIPNIPRPNFFGSNPTTDEEGNPVSGGGSFSDILGSFLPSLFGGGQRPGAGPGIFPFPDFGSIPNGNENSTYEVTEENGTRIEVNQTVTRSDGGNFIFRHIIVRYSPDEEGGSTSGTDSDTEGETGPVSPFPEVPAEAVDPSVNKVETGTIEDFS